MLLLTLQQIYFYNNCIVTFNLQKLFNYIVLLVHIV